MLKKLQFLPLLLILMMLLLAAQPARAFDNQNWNAVLQHFVDSQGLVDYQGLSRDRAQFDAYIQSIRTDGPMTRPEQFAERNQQLAYYINAYNALVFEGVLNRGPEQKSVWSGLISGLNFFVRMDVTLDGGQTNLKTLEDDLIRSQYADPRIHAALNCASISCPRLPQQAFEAQELDAQLDAAMQEFVGDEHHVRVDTASQRIYLSKIFDWFEEDFIAYEKAQANPEPDLIAYINRYRSVDQLLPSGYRLKFLDYDKGINRQKP